MNVPPICSMIRDRSGSAALVRDSVLLAFQCQSERFACASIASIGRPSARDYRYHAEKGVER